MVTMSSELHALVGWLAARGIYAAELGDLALLLAVAVIGLLLLDRLSLKRALQQRAVSEDAREKGTTPAATVEPPAPQGVFAGLKKSRDLLVTRLKAIVGAGGLSAEDYEALEEILVTSDLGVKTSGKLLASLKEEAAAGEMDVDALKGSLRRSMLAILGDDAGAEIALRKPNGGPLVVLVVGVNGVGKTTTIGKLASRFTAQGARVLLAACDTFRAAAAEQIEVWAERSGVAVERGSDGAKPSTVAFAALQRAKAEGFDVLLIDTAGRLHTRVNLMNELIAVVKLIERELPGAPHESILVLDATTGQNALQQAMEFHDKVTLTGIIITKLDGTPKGGIVVAIRDELGIPIRYIGVGESISDLRAFNATEFVDALLADADAEPTFAAAAPKAAVRATRRRPSEDAVPL